MSLITLCFPRTPNKKNNKASLFLRHSLPTNDLVKDILSSLVTAM